MTKLEICVDTFEGAEVAAENGADRIELCAALSEGGLTPSFGLMEAAAKLDVPVYAMIRPRSGHFRYSTAEKNLMLKDIEAAETSGLDGIVIGAIAPDRRLDLGFLSQALGQTKLPATLHRAFDTVADIETGVADAVDLGFERILTSGLAQRAELGLEALAQTVTYADGRISIMAGAGVTADNAALILNGARVDELHASCSVLLPPSSAEKQETSLGFIPERGLKSTATLSVKALRLAIENA